MQDIFAGCRSGCTSVLVWEFDSKSSLQVI